MQHCQIFSSVDSSSGVDITSITKAQYIYEVDILQVPWQQGRDLRKRATRYDKIDFFADPILEVCQGCTSFCFRTNRCIVDYAGHPAPCTPCPILAVERI